LWNAAYHVGYFLVLCFVLLVFFKSPGINQHFRSRLGDMVYGRAYRPYVYRMLAPLAIRGVKAAIPDALEARVKTRLWANAKVRNAFGNFKWNEENFSEFLICAGLTFLCYWGFAQSMRSLFDHYYDAPRMFSRAVPLLALAGVPAFFKYTSYIYDPPLLLLFTLALLCLQRRQWALYLLIFVLNCINKETAILLPFLFSIYYRPSSKLPARTYWGLLGVQLTLFFIIKTCLARFYVTDPGGLVENHLGYNLWWLQLGYSWGGYNEIPALAPWVLLALLVGGWWREKPLLLRQALLMLLPLLTLTFFLGALDELRDYYEIYPALLILILHTAARWCGIPLQLRDDATFDMGPTAPRAA
jgi:hypothetical protein